MEHVKHSFSIKDLENLSGVKAHTIRIWEKRYEILNPERTDTNIRSYSLSNLQKILNITFLNSHGYKISRIAKLSESEIVSMVKSVAASSSEENRAMNSLKIAMMNFDRELFTETYNKLIATNSFRDVFSKTFLPLLNEIGLLWQTDTINPVHEHFIVNLVKEKLYLNFATLECKCTHDKDLYVLFLPENEIHDLGILYLNYELNYHNKRTIYLGPSMPLKDMKYLLHLDYQITFICYMTVSPTNIDEYLSEYQQELGGEQTRNLHILGNKVLEKTRIKLPKNIFLYQSVPEFTNQFMD